MDAFIVGAGASGFLHALALRSASVRIAAVYDPVAARAAWLADLTGARPVDSLNVDADLVAICSPPAFHVEQAERLAAHGRITLVEKPVACDIAELTRLAACPGVVPVLQWRAGRSAHQLRAAFATCAFGRAPRIECTLHLMRDQAYFRSRDDGSWPRALLSIGIHAVDLLLWCIDRPATRTDFTDGCARGALTLRFDDGTVADVRIALGPSERNVFSLRVRGARRGAHLLATEDEPTAIPLRWRGAEPPLVTTGAMGSPLLVPYLRSVLAGERIGVNDVAAAHRLVMAA